MPSSVRLACVAPHLVERAIVQIDCLLREAVEHCGDWTVEGIKNELAQGALLWITHDDAKIHSFAITVLLVTPKGLVCRVLACAGHDDDWPSKLRGIERYAAQEGCISLRIEGRNGWARIFRDYKTAWVALEKRLVN